MNLYSLSLLSFSFGVVLICILALVKRKDAIAFRFLFFSISASGWAFLASLWFTQNYSHDTTLFLDRLSHSFAAFLPITWAHFVFKFIEKKEPFRFFYFISYACASFFLILSPTRFFIDDVYPIMDFKLYTHPGPLYFLYVIFFHCLVPYGFYHLFRAYTKAEGLKRAQLKYLVVGTIVGFVSGDASILPIFGVKFPQVLLLLMPLYPILTGIALIKYGLFDFQQIADAFQREKMTALGVMAASLNHELRNPLYIAKGKIESYLDSAERGIFSQNEKSEKADETTRAALSQLERAMDIIQKFSDFAKPSSQKAAKEKIVLEEIISEVLGLVSNEIELKKIRLNQIRTNGLSVYANRRQMEEVLFNLIVNACHAMDQKGELRLNAYQPNGKVVIEISDNGCGIERESLDRIFDPFYSTKGKKGSGLGLYITKQLVERNGGKISVQSRLAQGTIFTLEFQK